MTRRVSAAELCAEPHACEHAAGHPLLGLLDGWDRLPPLDTPLWSHFAAAAGRSASREQDRERRLGSSALPVVTPGRQLPVLTMPMPASAWSPRRRPTQLIANMLSTGGEGTRGVDA